jgi:hypothetical protein
MPQIDYTIGRERYGLNDFVSTFGMCEMEVGIADIVNKAKDDGCLVADVHFDKGDLKSDTDAFSELLAHGWLVESHGRYKLDGEAVRRIHRRFPNL